MKTFTQKQEQQLIKNHQANFGKEETTDFKPVVKLMVRVGGNATWLLSELEPESRIAFGLCDLGMGSPELGYVSIDDLEKLGWQLERDMYFEAKKTLKEYTVSSRNMGSIVA